MCILFDGKETRTEADEYVEITNVGDGAQDLFNWRLLDATQVSSPIFEFPTYILQPGEIIRVYTNEDHPEWGGFSFQRKVAIWSNDNPNTAALYDHASQLVSSKSYDHTQPPGCP